LSTLTSSTFSAVASPWAEVATIYRRICVLRLRGQTVDSAHLESIALTAALAAAELAHATPAEFEQRMRALFQAEEDRVHSAAILAELLAPLLAERLGSAVAPARPASVPAPRPPAMNPAPTASEPAAIADLIEGMLDQQRTAPRR
jgi:hypothetical protein